MTPAPSCSCPVGPFSRGQADSRTFAGGNISGRNKSIKPVLILFHHSEQLTGLWRFLEDSWFLEPSGLMFLLWLFVFFTVISEQVGGGSSSQLEQPITGRMEGLIHLFQGGVWLLVLLMGGLCSRGQPGSCEDDQVEAAAAPIEHSEENPQLGLLPQ